MMNRKSFMIIFAISAVVSLFVFFLVKTLLFEDQEKIQKINRPLRNLSLDLVDPKEELVHFADFKGSKLIINFWATWCESCKDEAKTIERFWKDHKEKAVIVIGVAIDSKEDEVRRFGAFYGKSYRLAIDKTGEISVEFGVTGVPETFYVDENGMIKNKFVGPISYYELKSLMKE